MSHLKSRWLIPIMIGIILVMGVLPAMGQTAPKKLVYDLESTGVIDDNTVSEKWAFTANGTDRMMIIVERTDGTLVPSLELQDKSGNVLATAAQDDTFARAMIDPMVLPAPGSYIVVVSRYASQDGKTSGGYKLNVNLLGVGADYAGTSIVQGTLQVGSSRNGSLANNHWFDLWAVNLDASRSLIFNVNRLSGTLVPSITILDANQQVVAHADADDTFATATIAGFTPPQSGQYTVMISRVDDVNGNTSGDYEVSLDSQ